MKAHEALIAWTPVGTPDFEQTAGEVVVSALPCAGGHDWVAFFERVGGAAYVERRKLRGDASTLRMFLDFHQIVVRDGIDPRDAHEAFLAIDEYAESIAPDIPGARDPRVTKADLRNRRPRSSD